jgi:hypothetical protein
MTNPQIKACVTCAHFATELDIPVCTHPSLLIKKTNYVYGGEWVTAPLCALERAEDRREVGCGPEGRFWEAKENRLVCEEATQVRFWTFIRDTINGLLGGFRP